MKENLTELVFILDKSGSMSGLEKDTIGGFNSLIQKQKKEEGEALVTTVLFDDKISVLHDSIDLKQVEDLTDKDYMVGGCTALLDAVGITVNAVRNKQKKMPDAIRASKTIVVITTDGFENSSKEYTYNQIKKLINEVKEKDNYEFLFLGANIDAGLEAEKLGIQRDNAVRFNNDEEGIKLNYCCIDKAIKNVRSGNKINKNWKAEIEKDKQSRDI